MLKRVLESLLRLHTHTHTHTHTQYNLYMGRREAYYLSYPLFLLDFQERRFNVRGGLVE